MPSRRRRIDWLDWLGDRAFQGLVWLVRRLPWRTRIRAMGWLAARVIGPLAGYRRRALDNLAYIYPDMPADRARAIADAALDNMGRTIVENYSPEDQVAALAGTMPEGPGWPELAAAAAARRPVLIVSAHYGNWQALRVVLNRNGFDVGGLFRPFNNPYANAHYVRSIERVGGRAFPRTRRGLVAFVRTLRDGGQVAMMVDQHVANGTPLAFLGKPAATSLAAAEIALKQGALLVPCYGERGADGFSMTVLIERPIPHSDPVTMTRALNDSLAARIAARPDQWFWVHRRWKPKRIAAWRARHAAAAAAEDAEDTLPPIDDLDLDLDLDTEGGDGTGAAGPPRAPR